MMKIGQLLLLIFSPAVYGIWFAFGLPALTLASPLIDPPTATRQPAGSLLVSDQVATPIFAAGVVTPTSTLSPVSPPAMPPSTVSIPLLMDQFHNAAVRTYARIRIIYGMAVNGDYVWAATGGGVVRWNSTDGRYVVYTTADGLVSNKVFRIAIDRTGNVWASSDAGLSRFDGKTWLSYPLAGPVSNAIAALTFDKTGHLWIGTERGVSKEVIRSAV